MTSTDDLQSPDWRIRYESVFALAEEIPMRVLLDTLLQDEDYRVQAAAILALGNYTQAVDALAAFYTHLPKPDFNPDQAENSKVLLVFDEIGALTLFRIIMERATDFQVLLARDGKQGLEIFVKQSPEIIYMNKNMPGLGGYLTTELMLREKSVPVVFISNSAILKETLKCGAVDLLSASLMAIDFPEMTRTLSQNLFDSRINVLKLVIVEALTKITRQSNEQEELINLILSEIRDDKMVSWPTRQRACIALNPTSKNQYHPAVIWR